MHSLLQLDDRVFLAINGLGTPGLDPVFIAITWLGHAAVIALLVLVPMALLDRGRLREHIVAMALSIALGALCVEGIKWGVGRDRPARHFAAASGHPGVPVRLPEGTLLDRSFPSGHTQAAFGVATYESLLYPALAPILLLAALLVGVSRIYLGVHFPLDVLVGGLLGAVFSWAGFRIQLRRRAAWKRPRDAV